MKKLYGVPQLKERGWTDTAIRRFLPDEPDERRDNPHYRRAGAPMKFWLQARVHRVEKTKRFLQWREGVSARKEAATTAVLTRVSNMNSVALGAEITIKRGLSYQQIHDLAADTHGGNYDGNPRPFVWSNRTARNCIRHNLTNYEALWKLCNRGDTGSSAYEILRERVDTVIDEAYPQFRDDSEPLG